MTLVSYYNLDEVMTIVLCMLCLVFINVTFNLAAETNSTLIKNCDLCKGYKTIVNQSSTEIFNATNSSLNNNTIPYFSTDYFN